VATIHRNRVQGLEAKTSNTAKRSSAQKRAREARDDPLGVLRALNLR
jgi:flagellin-like hook-associated protein FlgL